MKKIFIGIFCFLVIIQAAYAQTITVDHPLASSAHNTTTSIKINWTNDSLVEHFQVWYTTNPAAACSGSSSAIPCPAQSGDWTCIESHPYYAQERDWPAPNINSSDVRIRIEGHDSVHSTVVNSCSGSFTVAQRPTQATNLVSNTLSSSQIQLIWSAGTGLISGYRVFRNGANIANTTSAQLSYLDSGLSPSTTYEYSIITFNPVGDSEFSNNATNNTTPIPPNITSFSPPTPVTDRPGASRTFTVNIDQTVNVNWYINSSLVQTNNNVAVASYTNNSAQLGAWNVTAIVSNQNGSDIQEWVWRVIDTPQITFVPPTDSNGSTVNRDWTYINASVETVSSAISACLLEWQGVNESISIVGSGNRFYCSLNKTGLTSSAYTYRAYANNSNNVFNVSETRMLTISLQAPDTSPPSMDYSVSSQVANGTDASIFVNATDPSGVSGVWAVITKPNSVSITINLTNRATNFFFADMLGTYNIIIYSVDASNNLGSVSSSFTSVVCINNQTRSCGSILSDAGACEFGTETCANNNWGACTGVVGPTTETCNGVDEDCDGQIDEDADCCTSGQTRQCGSNIGVCEFGVSTCVNSGWGVCQGGANPQQEICNDSLDNNCNGQTDEECQLCSNGLLDANEEGVDCGGACPNACPTGPSIFGFILIIAGVVVLVVIILLVAHFKSKGKELTWGELKKKWTPAGKI